MSVHRRLRLLTFPTRTGAAAKAARPGTISWFPDTESLRTTLGASTTPDQRGARGDAPARFTFRSVNSVGVQNRAFRGSMAGLCAPTDASKLPSRTNPHGSGSMPESPKLR